MTFLTLSLTVRGMSKELRPTRKGEVTVKGATLRAFRRLQQPQMSQAALASIATAHLRDATGDPTANISESLIALIETNRRQPSLLNAEAIAAALGVELEALAWVNSEDAA